MEDRWIWRGGRLGLGSARTRVGMDEVVNIRGGSIIRVDGNGEAGWRSNERIRNLPRLCAWVNG